MGPAVCVFYGAAKKTSISASTLSRIYNRTRKPGPDNISGLRVAECRGRSYVRTTARRPGVQARPPKKQHRTSWKRISADHDLSRETDKGRLGQVQPSRRGEAGQPAPLAISNSEMADTISERELV
jgi:hypothetical protein